MLDFKKKLFIVMLVIIMFLLYSKMYCSSFGNGYNKSYIPDDSYAGYEVRAVELTASRIFNTVSTIIQVVAVAGVIITGLKYLLSPAEARANLKKRMIYTIIGIVLVVSGAQIVKFIVKVTQETL